MEELTKQKIKGPLGLRYQVYLSKRGIGIPKGMKFFINTVTPDSSN